MESVLITDEKAGGYHGNTLYFAVIDAWARKHCSSYQGCEVQDVSDVSLMWDEIAEYKFGQEADATLFKLKWK